MRLSETRWWPQSGKGFWVLDSTVYLVAISLFILTHNPVALVAGLVYLVADRTLARWSTGSWLGQPTEGAYLR